MTALIAVAVAAASEAGLVRQNNEDAAYSGRWLYAVADGMGGHAAGEVASAAVIESLRGRDVEVPPAALLRTLGGAVADANREVARRAAEAPARRPGRDRPYRRLPRVPAARRPPAPDHRRSHHRPPGSGRYRRPGASAH